MRRTNSCLAMYFDPDNDPATKADVRQAFVRALGHIPAWAMHRAFDGWEKSGTRRPSPAEIVILAERELKPIAEELARRDRDASEAKAAADERSRNRVSPDAAARILAEAGMSPDRLEAFRRFPMAGSVAEAKDKLADWNATQPHWSDTAAQDSAEWDQLRKSRDANDLVKSARAHQAKGMGE